MNIVLTQQARFDLRRLRASLAETDQRAAQRAADALAKAIQSLDLFPNRGHPSKLAGARELIVPFGRSAYVVRYVHATEANEIVIIRIWHGRERRD